MEGRGFILAILAKLIYPTSLSLNKTSCLSAQDKQQDPSTGMALSYIKATPTTNYDRLLTTKQEG